MMKEMSSTILITDSEPNKLINTFENAFKTKTGTEHKRSETHKWIKQDKYMFRQIYPIGSWLVDLVKFGEYWYVFFVEACSRYLIVIQGNSNFLTNDAVEINLQGRVPSNIFLEAFQQFERMNSGRIRLLIGDSERAFWSQTMLNYYASRKIATIKINVSEDGHTRMSILDRVVKTIRDACYKLKYPESVEPKDMINVVITYNNTTHATLTKFLGDNYTPLELHTNKTLQEIFNNNLDKDNLDIRNQKGYIILPGTEVVVKNNENKKFEKHHSNTIAGKWFVVEYKNSAYTISNENGVNLQNIPRSRLRPIY